MKEIRILLVEDEFISRRYLRKKLIEIGYSLFEEAQNTEEAIELLRNKEIDLAILDINLGLEEKDGVWLGALIKEKYSAPFIYLTAYSTTNILQKAIKTRPSAFLTKPFKLPELTASLELAILNNDLGKKKLSNELLIQNSEHYVKVNIADIDYIESNGNYVNISISNKIYKHRSTLKKIFKSLPQEEFIQIHRAFIINASRIEKQTSSCISIQGQVLPFSRYYRKKLK